MLKYCACGKEIWVESRLKQLVGYAQIFSAPNESGGEIMFCPGCSEFLNAETLTPNPPENEAVEIYLCPLDSPKEVIPDKEIRIQYNGYWVDFRNGEVIVRKDCGNSQERVVNMDASIIKIGVCVPASWTDKDVLTWITEESPPTNGFRWSFADGERIQCSKNHENVHIMFES